MRARVLRARVLRARLARLARALRPGLLQVLQEQPQRQEQEDLRREPPEPAVEQCLAPQARLRAELRVQTNLLS